MNCNRVLCNNLIPNTRRSNAKYCSNSCYKAAKKVRDALDYSKRTVLYDKVKFNDSILRLLFETQYEIPKVYFENLGFYFDNYLVKDHIIDETLYVMYEYSYSIRRYEKEDFIKIWMNGNQEC